MLLAFWNAAALASPPAAQLRSFDVDDVLHMESIGRIVATPDGRFVVFEQTPPYETAPNLDALDGLGDFGMASHLYLSDLQRSPRPRPLFPQRTNGGYWLGGRSPNGRRLAVYSLIGSRLRAGVHDLTTGRTRWFDFTPVYDVHQQRPVWLDDDTLVYPVDEDAGPPRGLRRLRLVARRNELAARGLEGGMASATTMESEPSGEAHAGRIARGTLVRVQFSTGRVSTLASGDFQSFRRSPTGRYLATLERGGSLQPPPGRLVTDLPNTYRLVIIDLATGRRTYACDGCLTPEKGFAWDSRSDRLAFYGFAGGAGLPSVRAYLFDAARENSAVVDLARLRLIGCEPRSRPGPILSLNGDLLVYADRQSGAGCDARRRRDWYRIGAGARITNLTESLPSVSGEVVGLSDDAFVMRSGPRLWRVPLAGPVRRLAQLDDSETVTNDAMSAFDTQGLFSGTQPPRTLTLATAGSVGRFDVATEDFRHGPALPPAATLVALSDDLKTAIIRQASASGSSEIMALRQGGASLSITRVNGHLAETRRMRQASVRFTHSDQDWEACLLLPGDWTAGHPLPTIVQLYPGADGACSNPPRSDLDPDAPELLVARGYAVLFAPTPIYVLQGEAAARSRSARVMAAVDAAVQAGYADPNRLGVRGTSQGQLSVLQVLTETDRFKAAMIGFGISDTISQYGQVSLDARLEGMPNREALAVGSYGRFEYRLGDWRGAAPWEDSTAHIYNTPIFYANRIETPLLIFHSDLDGFGLNQSGEIFSALYRQRRRASYVTYWGEAHGLLSPANIRDYWHRTFAWFDTYLRQADDGEAGRNNSVR